MNLTQVSDSYLLFFSDDAELQDAVLAKLSQREKAGDGSMVIVQETLHINSISESDIILYDLDLANGNLERAVKDVCRVKKRESRKPLILVGEKQALSAALADPEINHRVSRSFAKPVMANQVIIAIDMVVKQNNDLSTVTDQPIVEKQANHTKPLLAGAAILAVAGIGWFAVSQNTVPESPPTTPSSSEQLQASTALPVSNQPDAEANNNSEIDTLNALAEKALAEGRNFAPEGDNALYYFDRALEIDSYNNVAYTGRQKMLDDLKASFPMLLSEQRFDEASKSISWLSRLEPFSDDNAKMQRALDDAKAAAAQAEQSSDEADVSVNADSETDDGAPNMEVSNPTPQPTPQPRLDQPKPTTKTSVAAKPSVTNDAKRAEKREQKIKPEQNIQAKKAKAAQESNVVVTKPPTAPVLIKQVDAEYPRRAFALDIEGWVELEYQVDPSGTPINIRVLAEEPKKMFTKAATKALKKWRFEPARNSQTGEAILSTVSSTKFNFALGG